MNKGLFAGLVLLCLWGLVGCQTPEPGASEVEADSETATMLLSFLTVEEVNDYLAPLHLGETVAGVEPNTVLLRGSPGQLLRALIVLELVDSETAYLVESLGPVAIVRSLPSNAQIGQVAGGIHLGTFTKPAPENASQRGLLDVYEDQVLLVAPADLALEIKRVIAVGRALEHMGRKPTPKQGEELLLSQTKVSVTSPLLPEPTVVTATTQPPALPLPEPTVTPPPHVFDLDAPSVQDPNSLRGVLRPFEPNNTMIQTRQQINPVALPNGEDVLEMSLPETMDLIDLLDLAGEYLDLDYVYDSAKIRNQTVTLRLHGKREGKFRIKDLYTLLETSLKFKGLAMIRKAGNLVAIVPVAEALDIDPTLLGMESSTIQAGDMVITRVFELKHVDVTSVSTLLQTMKLSVALSPVPETQTLFVTCYAHRMPRIVELVEMVDRPGDLKEFRYRQLCYTHAPTVAAKVQTLASELQDIQISVSQVTKGKPASKGATTTNTPTSTVYMDTDERTNRLLMIGASNPLDMVEKLIDTLDVVQQDLRLLHVYIIHHIEANDAVEKLSRLGLLSQSAQSSPSKSSSTGGGPQDRLTEMPQLLPIEATNSLLINATYEQHQRIDQVLCYVDVTRSDKRSMTSYAIQHVEAATVMEKLDAMGLTDTQSHSTRLPKKISRTNKGATPLPPSDTDTDFIVDPAQVIVLETTNSLLVNATSEQHQLIQTLIAFVDTQTPQESIPYEIYFLNNQSPEHLAEVLSKLVQETLQDEQGKITEKKPRDSNGEIVIVPDELTFSLIVYANRKNQEWISLLIKQLDREPSQVLIDVTLVEISKTEEFNYDLNVITSIPDLAATSGLMGPLAPGVATKDIIDKLHAAGRSRFIDMQSNSGVGNGFYGDEHVMILLNLMEEKKYGRVLAKPKILVNDNETGNITTKDITHVQKLGQAVLPGNSEAITTSIDYTPYEAGISLEIIPHISETDLLRLEIVMTRSDFIATEGEKPPDSSSSDLNTVVTIPDGSTIILGGMLKMNQTKGGTKVPGLGDLPLVGGLFRGTNRSDIQKRLYIFVKAEIIRPAQALTDQKWDLNRISDENREAFEKIEKRFQEYQLWPGVDPKVTEPNHVIDAK